MLNVPARAAYDERSSIIENGTRKGVTIMSSDNQCSQSWVMTRPGGSANETVVRRFAIVENAAHVPIHASLLRPVSYPRCPCMSITADKIALRAMAAGDCRKSDTAAGDCRKSECVGDALRQVRV